MPENREAVISFGALSENQGLEKPPKVSEAF